MNSGKVFENLIKDSCKLQDIVCIRLKDAGYQGEQTERRFTITNVCDFILFDSEKMLLLEAKSTKGKSIPISRLKQLEKLHNEYSKVLCNNYRAGFIFEFCLVDVNIYIYVSIDSLDKIISNTAKKSINYKELLEGGKTVHKYIPVRKRKERLNLERLINEI